MSAIRKEKRPQVAGRMAQRLGAAETAIDTALTEVARLMADTPQARLEAQVAAAFGHPILTELAGAFQMMVESRGRIVAVHELLDSARSDLGLPKIEIMPGADKPPTGLHERPALAVVGAA